MSQKLSANPRVVGNKSKYREEPTKVPIHIDKRVFKGATHSAVYIKKDQEQQEREAQAYEDAQKESQTDRPEKPKSIYDIRPKPQEKRAIDLTPYLIDPEDSRVSTAVGSVAQTDDFSADVSVEIPKKQQSSGIHVSTQTVDAELFEFDAEVMPILEVLADKTIEQSVLELEEHHEVSSIDNYKREVKEMRRKRLEEVTEIERNEMQNYSQIREKVDKKYFSFECQKYFEYKVHSLHNSKQIAGRLKDHVIQGLVANGYMQSWSNISVKSQAKNFIMDDTEAVLAEKNNFRAFINSFFEKVYMQHCFEPRIKEKTVDGLGARQKQGVTMSFKQPQAKLVDFKSLFMGMIAARDKDEPNVVQNYIEHFHSEILTRNADLLDDNELANCEVDEQHVTDSFLNLYKTLSCDRNYSYTLLDNLSKLYVKITYDDEIIITSSQSRVAFTLLAQDEDCVNCWDVSELQPSCVEFVNEQNPAAFNPANKKIVNECQTLDLYQAFTDIKMKFGHFVLFARIKNGLSEFFKNVSVSVSDNSGKSHFTTRVADKLNLEDTSSKQLALMKVSKVHLTTQENQRDVVDIKKENVNKEFDPSQDECNYVDLTHQDKSFNITLEKFEIECSESEVLRVSEVLSAVTQQKLVLPLTMRLNPVMFKNESDFKKNNLKKFKIAKLLHSEALTKCYDQYEVPQIRDFVVKDFKMPSKSDSMKAQCQLLNNALITRHPSWRTIMSNSQVDAIGLFSDNKLIHSVDVLFDHLKKQDEIEIRLMNKADEARQDLDVKETE